MCRGALRVGLTLDELPWSNNDKSVDDAKAAIEESLKKKRLQQVKDNEVWNDLRTIFVSSSGIN